MRTAQTYFNQLCSLQRLIGTNKDLAKVYSDVHLKTEIVKIRGILRYEEIYHEEIGQDFLGFEFKDKDFVSPFD